MDYRQGLIVCIAALGLAGCSTSGPTRTADYPVPGQYPTGSSYPSYPGEYPTYPAPQAPRYGYVEAVEVIGETPQGPGIGAIGGAIAGGVLGNRVGSGSGRTAATIGGAVIGGVVGHQVEKRVRDRGDAYRIRVRMDDGSYQTITQETHDNIQVGERVRVENGRVWRS